MRFGGWELDGLAVQTYCAQPEREVMIMAGDSDLTEEELRKIDMRCEAATKGPWQSFVEGRDHQSGSDFIQTAGEDIELTGATTADQDFIAHARQDIPRTFLA